MRHRTLAPLLALMMAGCATPTANAAMAAAGLSHSAYCVLTPEARAELRRRLGVRVQLLSCPSDPRARRPNAWKGSGAAGQD